MAVSRRLWVVWSWRDLRRRWVMVTAIALIVAVGTGVYAGLGGTSAWRLQSNDASYAALGFHDLKATLPEGAFVDAGSLRHATLPIAHADWVTVVEERLVVPTQLDASVDGKVVLVPGQLVGAEPNAAIDKVFLRRRRPPPPRALQGRPARSSRSSPPAHDLAPSGTVRIGGGAEIQYTGVGYSPEYFRVVGRTGLADDGVRVRRAVHLAGGCPSGDRSPRHGQRPRAAPRSQRRRDRRGRRAARRRWQTWEPSVQRRATTISSTTGCTKMPAAISRPGTSSPV